LSLNIHLFLLKIRHITKYWENWWHKVNHFFLILHDPYVEPYLSLPKKVWETYCFCSVSSYYYYYYSISPFFPRTINLSTADLRNYWTEFHETWWSYRYMFLVGPKVFSFAVKAVKVIFWGVQRGWGLL
jgi:hypothetical protein